MDTTGRVPPNSLDAEAVLVSACLLVPGLIDEVQAFCSPVDCYSVANRLILEAAWDLHSKSRPIDMVSVATHLRDAGKLQQVGGSAYLAQVVDATPAVHNAEEHAREVRAKSRLRQVIQVCQRYAAEGYGCPGDVQDFIDQVERAVFDIAQAEQQSDLVEIREVVRDCYRVLSEAAERGTAITGTAVGITELDRMTSGAHPGDFWVIAGRPGSGKTSLAITMALSIAAPRACGLASEADANGDATAYELGGVVPYFSMEMPREQIGNRLLAAEARVDLSRIRSGHLRQDDWSKLTCAVTRLARMPIWIDDTPALTMLELRAKCRRLKARCQREGKKLAAIMVDYLLLMQGLRTKGQSREEEISELSRGMKIVAKELAAPVLALTQLNRECEKRPDKRPQLSDIRESGSLEQDADNVLFVYRDEMYHKESVDHGLAELILAKQRNGRTGMVKVKWTDFCSRFDNLLSTYYDDFDAASTGSTDADYGLEQPPHWADR